MIAKVIAAAMLVLLLALAGCSGGDTATETTNDSESTDAADSSSSDVIILEDGWRIQDVITPEEVGDIVGATLIFFPEAGSAAQEGRPEASYVQEGVEGSKIYFTVNDDGGTDELEIIKGYAVEGTLEEVPGLGDEAYALEYEDGDVGVILVRGDAFIRVDWPASVYGSDAAGLGSDLANLLMSKMYE